MRNTLRIIALTTAALSVISGCENKAPETPFEQQGADATGTSEPKPAGKPEKKSVDAVPEKEDGKPEAKPVEAAPEKEAEKTTENTPVAVGDAWVKAMNERDADALYALYSREMLDQIEGRLKQVKEGNTGFKERFCKDLWLEPDKLDTLTGREFNRLVINKVIRERLWPMYGKEWEFATAGSAELGTKKEEASVKLELRANDKIPRPFYLKLVKEDGTWKLCSYFPDTQEPRSANEASAISSLRTIMSAQELYKTRTGFYGDYGNLNDGKIRRYIDPVLTRADPDHPEHLPKAGYVLDINVNAENSDWWAVATPARWGVDGNRNFKIDSSGVIYYNKTEGDTTNFGTVLGN
jgi:hypothetical protein